MPNPKTALRIALAAVAVPGVVAAVAAPAASAAELAPADHTTGVVSTEKVLDTHVGNAKHMSVASTQKDAPTLPDNELNGHDFSLLSK